MTMTDSFDRAGGLIRKRVVDTAGVGSGPESDKDLQLWKEPGRRGDRAYPSRVCDF